MKALLAEMGSHVPPGQLGCYLLVGCWNTLFGYLSFVVLTAILSHIMLYSYLPASIISGFVNITMAFLLHKHFVFRTKGNYLSEWSRCVIVYGSGAALNLALLPIIVQSLRHWTRYVEEAPYIAGALLTGFGVVYNFFGHKKFSFQGSAQNSC